MLLIVIVFMSIFDPSESMGVRFPNEPNLLSKDDHTVHEPKRINPSLDSTDEFLVSFGQQNTESFEIQVKFT